MFASAYKLAAQYTHPVVAAFRRQDGQCGTLFGSFVVVNREGWLVTALHIVQGVNNLLESQEAYDDLVQQREDRLNDPLLSADQKQHWVEANAFSPDMITDLQLWWGGLSSTGDILNGYSLNEMDLAIGQLDGYTPPATIEYPRFWNPDQDMPVASSLCKMGYPVFSHVPPTFDAQTGAFGFPEGVMPPALFPLEGILTRTIAHTFDEVAARLPCLHVETSTPGLPGHSGGPIVDVEGTIWAIQSMNLSTSLGIPTVTDAAASVESTTHDSVAFAWGIHATTITGFLRDHGVAFALSAPPSGIRSLFSSRK